ncbi:MAG: helix-turn-helix domain-containing protein [Oscillospiraceae bacterium]|nr:helix-turn-helix domain-containing protein [Oscillospiraceae bacterium]
MFDVSHVSSTLKNARIKKNLTQSALADRLGVTYQAVSNWERGNSLPDISNLGNLCDILDVNLYELIGATQNAELVDELLSGSCDLREASIRDVASIAPMLPPEQLMSVVEAIADEIKEMAVLVQLAPFIDSDLIEKIGAALVPTSIGEIVALSPFVSNEMCAAWIEKLDDVRDFELDVGLLSALGPYLSREKMDQLSERVVPDTLIVLDSVAPFLSRDALERLADRLETITFDDYAVGMECLSPFLSKDAMRRLHKKIVDAPDGE